MNRPDLSELIINGIRSVSVIYTARGTVYRNSDRPCWALVYKWEGATEYFMKNGEIAVSDASRCVLLPRGSSYEWHAVESGRYSIIEFDACGTRPEILVYTLPSPEKFFRAFSEVQKLYDLKDPLWHMKAMEKTYSLLLMAINDTATSGYLSSEKQKILRPAVDYMHGHFNEPLTNDGLAALCGISTVYFRKLFTTEFGISPIRYLNDIRIAKAREILESDFGSVTDIALSLGYPNIYCLSKAFRARTGMSPREYLASVRENKIPKN